MQQIHPEGQRCQPKDPAPPVVRADTDILEQQKHCCRGDDRIQCLIAVDGIHKTVQVQGVFHPQRQHPVEQPRRRSCQICQQTQPAGHGHPVFAEIGCHKIQDIEPDKAVPVIYKGHIRCPVEQRAPHALQQQRHQQQRFVLPPVKALHHRVQHRHREVHQKISRGEPVAVGGKGQQRAEQFDCRERDCPRPDRNAKGEHRVKPHLCPNAEQPSGADRPLALRQVIAGKHYKTVGGHTRQNKQQPVDPECRRPLRCRTAQPAVPDAVHQHDHHHTENAHRLKAAMPFLLFHTPFSPLHLPCFQLPQSLPHLLFRPQPCLIVRCIVLCHG